MKEEKLNKFDFFKTGNYSTKGKSKSGGWLLGLYYVW
jgi:hypothetical protein